MEGAFASDHVKSVRAPVLLFHGTEDKAVPYQQSVEFAEAVRRNGGIADLVSYQGEGHGFVKEANRRDLIEQIEKFLNKYVICQQHKKLSAISVRSVGRATRFRTRRGREQPIHEIRRQGSADSYAPLKLNEDFTPP